MAICEAGGFRVDCGEGHGCALLVILDTGEFRGFCESHIMRVESIASSSPKSADSKAILCCKGIRRAGLAELINAVYPDDVTAPDDRQDEIVNDCGESLSLAEHVERHGLVVG